MILFYGYKSLNVSNTYVKNLIYILSSCLWVYLVPVKFFTHIVEDEIFSTQRNVRLMHLDMHDN